MKSRGRMVWEYFKNKEKFKIEKVRIENKKREKIKKKTRENKNKRITDQVEKERWMTMIKGNERDINRKRLDLESIITTKHKLRLKEGEINNVSKNFTIRLENQKCEEE